MRFFRSNTQSCMHPGRWMLWILLVFASMPVRAAVSCTTESQMTAPRRDALASAARSMAVLVQQGQAQALRQQTIPPVAQDFSGIASSIQTLYPLIAKATLTVDDLYLLDASQQRPNTPQTSFTCGLPDSLMTVNFRFQ